MMCLHYRDDSLLIEDVSLSAVALAYDTPCYVYSRAAIEANWQAFSQAFSIIPHRICYAVKANGNLAILNMLAKLGAGFDIVSIGELERVLVAGGDVNKVIFSGVGKRRDEIIFAIEKGIHCFNIESVTEAKRIQDIASALGVKVNVSLRINPNIDANTHDYISTGMSQNKFGIAGHQVTEVCKTIEAMSALNLIGIACHIGSQITDLGPFESALDYLIQVYNQLKEIGISIKVINMGGGLGIIYHHENPPTIAEYASKLIEKLKDYPIEVIIEPGRAIVGNAGVLMTRVEYIKHAEDKNFAIVDAGMNDLIRPALYQSWQSILPVESRRGPKQLYDVVGPVCESADFLGKDRELVIAEGDLLAVANAGAYGFSMSSNYNTRPRAAEVLIDRSQMKLIRRREELFELYDHEANI